MNLDLKMEGPLERLHIDVNLSDNGTLHSMAEDVYRGLTSNPKYLLPKYFYDEEGSALFECITEVPEYYLARTERGLLSSISGDLMSRVRPTELVELGSGSSIKTRLLIDAGNGGGVGTLNRYVPFDVSSEMLHASAGALLQDYSSLYVHGVVGSFEHHLERIPSPLGRRLVVFLGSTIGNLTPPECRHLLSQVRNLLEPGDRLLLGVDLVKDVSVLEAAYNDSTGVTAEFNRNILRVLNRGLAADFRPEAFHHSAFFNVEESRVEMHLRPESSQTVQIEDIGLTLHIGPEETIWTESSYKFTQTSVSDMLNDAGLTLERWYTDAHSLFGLALAAPS